MTYATGFLLFFAVKTATAMLAAIPATIVWAIYELAPKE